MTARRSRWLAIALGSLLGLLSPGAMQAWTHDTQLEMAEWARSVAPPDLRRQMERHKAEFRKGVLELARDPETLGLIAAEDAQSQLVPAIRGRIDATVRAIELHRPFAEIVRRMGEISYLVALAGFPPVASQSDPQESRYATDFARYVNAVRPRFRVLFYASDRAVESPGELDGLLERTFERSRDFYPEIGGEYRRIGVADGRKNFDDRSTAFAIGALAYSHCVSDIAGVLRYIWLQAGGGDDRSIFSLDEDQIVLLSSGASAR